MRYNAKHDTTDAQIVRRLIRENPWATLVSDTEEGLVASHYPVLLDDTSDALAVVTHLGRPDDRVHDLGSREMLLIVAGPHGYVSPSWYAEGAVRAPTWNFSVAHCYGVPQVLSEADNIDVLRKLVAHFEQNVEQPMWLEDETVTQLVGGTVGIRLPITRFTCKVKMSQDKDSVSQQNVLDRLRAAGPYQQLQLADDMQRALEERIGLGPGRGC